MLEFSKSKKLLVAIVLLYGLAFALPNLLSNSQIKNLPDFMPTEQVNLGLDLQGGAHLVLEVDIKSVYTRAYENLEDDVRMSLRGGKDLSRLGYRELKSDGEKITFRAVKVQQIEEMTNRLRKDTQLVEVYENDGVFILKFTHEKLQQIANQSVEQTLEVLRSRIDEFGVSEPLVQRQGERRVIVELPGIEDVNRAKSIIGRTAQLSFHIVDDSQDVNRYISRRPPAGKVVMYETVKTPDGFVNRIPYLVKKRAEITGEHLADANSGFSSDDNSPAVFIRFDGVGTRKFGEVTTKNQGRRMAIVLDGQVYSAPVLREPILGGSAVVSGSFSVKEADDLSTVLRAGALPAPVFFAEERTVGPSLGRDSIESGKTAIVVGFIGVMAIMLLFYRGFGIAANVALLFNLVLILGVMTALGATLTMPGIAGIVLTIGMAVDANVLIFERIKEESRAKITPMAAMDRGFKSAFATILDANVTTLIAAVVLFAVGSGPIKGFALTLSVGILSSMFTAIMVTRLMLIMWITKVRPKKL